jgi:circadian clock protein KaiC
VRPTLYGLEQHLVVIHKLTEQFRPDCVVMDPVTNLTSIGDEKEIMSMLARVIDYLKQAGITTVFTNLTKDGSMIEKTEVGISSLMDTWLLLRQDEADGDRKRSLYIMKSRGMAHSNAVREFKLSGKGIQLEGSK